MTKQAVRQVYLRRIIVLLLVCVFWAVESAQAQEATPESTPDALIIVGRFTADTTLATSPNGRRLEDVRRGDEFFAYADDVQSSNNEYWVAVYPLRTGTRGWVPMDLIEAAELGSNPSLRRYTDGFCYTTPLAQRLDDASILDRYQHALYFVEEVPLVDLIESGEYVLLFNDRQPRLDLRLHQTANALLLPATWVIRHSGPLGPIWSDSDEWTLVYDCDPLPPTTISH